jgi:2-C-methyl-D-erythritol 4-phosphate cytidylyltransferase
MRTFAVILAGGAGSRMKSGIPKQFIPLAGLPVIMHTIQKFRDFDPKMEILVVLPEQYISLWKELCNEFKFAVEHQFVRGGAERFFSVKNALERIPDDSLVLIHDGVRPLVSIETIDRVRQKALEAGNAIPFVDVNESIRHVDANGSKAVDRDLYKIIQTPQAFHSKLIKEAYNQDYNPAFTDDASVLEAMGYPIELVLGNLRNIKITRSIDLILAESLINHEM